MFILLMTFLVYSHLFLIECSTIEAKNSNHTILNQTTATTLNETFSIQVLTNETYRQSRAFEKRNRFCPQLKNALPNGYVKLRSNNRIARFSCDQNFELVGNRYATCIRGRWNRDLPVCVSTSCPLKVTSQRPLIVKRLLYQNSVVDLSCELGYQLRFSNFDINNDGKSNLKNLSNSSYTPSSLRVYCVGRNWVVDDWSYNFDSINEMTQRIALRKLPDCEIFEDPVQKSISCHFEHSLCGWFQDNEDDFDWLRNYYTTPSYLDGTGPEFDHTYGPNKTGFYLYLESSYPRAPNDIARLYSPVYQHINNISVACFKFHYHMYGKAIGALKIYIKEKSQLFTELNPSWELIGDQGNKWSMGEVEIRPSKNNLLRPFQIIIEGILGHGHQGDIAIDDISLTLGKGCLMNMKKTSDIDGNSLTELSISDLADINQDFYNSSETSNTEDRISGCTPNSLLNNQTTMSYANSTSEGNIFFNPLYFFNSTSDNKTKSLNEIVLSIFKMKPVNETISTMNPLLTSTPISKNTSEIVNVSSTKKPGLSYTTSSNPTTNKFNNKWWKAFHNQMKETFRKQEEAKNWTKQLLNQTYNNNSSNFSINLSNNTIQPFKLDESISSKKNIKIPNDQFSNKISNTSKLNSIMAKPVNKHENKIEQSVSQSHSSHNENFSNFSSSWSFILFGIGFFLLMLVAVVYVLYKDWPIYMFSSPSNLGSFVARFVNRCKTLHNQNEDSELLMTDQQLTGNENTYCHIVTD